MNKQATRGHLMNPGVVPTDLPLADLRPVPDKLLTRQAANEGKLVVVNAARFVTIELAACITGLSDGAVRKRIERGIWREGIHWRRAPDNRIWIDMKGVERWVEGTE